MAKRKSSHPPDEQKIQKKKCSGEYALKIDAHLKMSLARFKIVSEQQLRKLTKQEGLDLQTAINSLVEKMRSPDDKFEAPQDDIDLVMEMTDFNEVDAVRTLIVKEELSKLKRAGMESHKAIDELVDRMKTLTGMKRKNRSTQWNSSILWSHNNNSNSNNSSPIGNATTSTSQSDSWTTSSGLYSELNNNAELDELSDVFVESFQALQRKKRKNLELAPDTANCNTHNEKEPILSDDFDEDAERLSPVPEDLANINIDDEEEGGSVDSGDEDFLLDQNFSDDNEGEVSTQHKKRARHPEPSEMISSFQVPTKKQKRVV